MKIALVSLDQKWEDKKANLLTCEKYINEASQNGVHLIIFPEMTLTAFSINTDNTSENIEDSFTIASFQALATKYNIAIIFGVVIKEKVKSSNRLYFLDNFGKVLNYYIKMHPFSFAKEDQYFISGNETKIVEFDRLKFGLTICYDLRFSNLYYKMALKNCDCIINIANWPSKRVDHWNTLLKSRAIESQLFVVGVNRVGCDGNNLEYIESSKIFSADGNRLTPVEKRDNMQIFNIDNKERLDFKNSFNTTQDMRDF